MNGKIRLCSLILVLSILGFEFTGCGKIGPPKIPEKTEPSPVTDLDVKLSCTKILLTWTRPFTKTDGTVLKKIEKMELFREIKMPETEKSKLTKDPGDKTGIEKTVDEEKTSSGKVEESDTQEVEHDTDRFLIESGQIENQSTGGDSDDSVQEQTETGEKSKYFSLSRKKIYTFEKDELIEILAKGDTVKYHDDGEDLENEIIEEQDRENRFFNNYQYSYTVKVFGAGDRESRDAPFGY